MKKGPRTGGLAEHGLVSRYRIPGVVITVIGSGSEKNSESGFFAAFIFSE